MTRFMPKDFGVAVGMLQYGVLVIFDPRPATVIAVGNALSLVILVLQKAIITGVLPVASRETFW